MGCNLKYFWLGSKTCAPVDLQLFIEHIKNKHVDSEPLYLLGHSMGGLITLLGVGKKLFTPQKILLSSPFLSFLFGDLLGKGQRERREKSTTRRGRWGKGHCVDQGSDRDDSARRGARWPNRGMRAAVAGST